MKKTTEEFFTKNYIVCMLAVFCCLLWGSASPCIKIGYKLFQIAPEDIGSQLLFAGIRFSLAGIMTILIGSLLEKKVLIPKRTNLYHIIELALVQTVIQYFFFYIGLANTTGVKASIIQGVNVFIAILVSSLIFRLEKLTFSKIIGCLIGFMGVVIIHLTGNVVDFSFRWNGEGFIILSTTAYAFSSVFIKRFSQTEHPYILSGYQFFLGGILLTVFGAAMGGKLAEINIKSMALLTYMAFLSAAAYTIWGILLKYNPVTKITIYSFVTPIFGVILSALILKETQQAFGIEGIISLAFICVGIYIVNKNIKLLKS